MTKIARPGTENDQLRPVPAAHSDAMLTQVARATDAASAAGASGAIQVAQGAVDAVEDLHATMRQGAQEVPEFGRAFADLMEEQTRESVDTLRTFAQAVNWSDVAQAQGKLVTRSFLRIAQFNARYAQSLFRGMAVMPAALRR